MIDTDRIPAEIIPLLEQRLGGRTDEISFPPPVFDALQGEVVTYDLESETLTNRFPVLAEHLNPYGNMQGGIIAAAIDNTIGPLSLIVSPPNFTRYIEVKYGKVVSPDLGHIYVSAKFIGQKRRQLFFEATVTSSDGDKLASAKATHWVID
ncbi:MAG: PaaI family thioesterase [Gammaproteobacteria bacterium]|nr:PaaI family thioesterase [Gammaproteobacteria bacterium]